jgi:diguanylate cyclase (GGDEF)-like protein
MWRALLNPTGWRNAGQAEFAFTTRAIFSVGGLPALRWTVASLGIMMFPVGIITELMPYAPNTPWLRIVHLTAAALGAVIGALWILRPWPSASQAIAFLVAADILLGIGVTVLGAPEARMSSANLLAMLGLFAAFLLGWRVLLVHCLFAVGLVTGLLWYAVAVDGRVLLDMVAFAAPAAIIVGGLPVVVQAVVELSRYGVTQVAQEWYVDSLTGLLNRRGMEDRVRRLVAATDEASSVYLSAAVDLDDFKSYNGTYGHLAGDDLLAAFGNRLDSAVPRALVARNGGDEFAVFAVRASVEQARRTAEALCAYITALGGDGAHEIAASAGVTIAPAAAYRDRIREIAAVADAALYEAKRSADRSTVVRELTIVPSPGHGPEVSATIGTN